MNRLMKKVASAAVSLTMLASTAVVCPISASAAETTYTYGAFTYVVRNNQVGIVFCNSTAAQVTVPEKIDGKYVTGILTGAFYNHTNLKKINLPKNISVIEPFAFYNCSNLTEFNVPFFTTTVAPGVFAGCTKLNTVVINGPYTVFMNGTFTDPNGNASAFNGYVYIDKFNAYPAPAFASASQRRYYGLGDVNFDGVVDGVDASRILSMYSQLAGNANISDQALSEMKVVADVDRDGYINSIDASRVLSYYAKAGAGYQYPFEYYMNYPNQF